MSKSAMMEMFKSGKGPMMELPEAAMRVLECMADDPKNEIWVLSGLPVKGALERLAERVPKVGIVAENGCFVKTREIGNKSSRQSNGARWINMVANPDFAWKGPCVEILNYSRNGHQARSSRSVLHLSCGASGQVLRIPPPPSMTMPLPLPTTSVLIP
ncbi:hypothetical protein EDC04DRAFT_719979 [Pisolithus marmoratus]|nr:hypothetical protein EDC04DRAFT_719979 [Pisolithus marmoratus]